MSLWRWIWGGDGARSEAPWERQRLEQLLYRLADDIAREGDDRIDRKWSGQVRGFAGQVGAGSFYGVAGFLGLFDGDSRNTIHEQPFARTRTFREAYRLATTLANEHFREGERRRVAQIVLRPWKEGRTGKAVVYKDGTVVATEDDAEGRPNIGEIKVASKPGAVPVAVIGIKPDGSCDVYRNERDARWLAVRLHDHNPALHIEQSD